MNWSQKIFNYCERSVDPSFWAEPLNAWSNAAFCIAALVALRQLWVRGEIAKRPAELALCAMVFTVGVGSFLFHTFATPWAARADVIPIAIFMYAYVAYALRRLLKLNWLLVLLGLAAFGYSYVMARQIACPPILVDIVSASRGKCLNGTIGYTPAFFALVIVAFALLVVRRPAWQWIAAAAVAFFCSMVFRTFDLEVCNATAIAGYRTGTHFMWHLLNGLTTYLLLMAAVYYGKPDDPQPRPSS